MAEEKGRIEKVSASVGTELDEATVKPALKRIQDLLKTGRGRKATTPRPQPATTRTSPVRRTTPGQVPDVRSVGGGFRTGFEPMRRFLASKMKQVTETVESALRNIVMGRRADSKSERPETGTQPAPPVVRQPPRSTPPPVAPAPVRTPRPPPLPVLPRVIPPPPPRPPVGRTTNIYNTLVTIDPRQMREWLELKRVLEMLKEGARAKSVKDLEPRGAKVYEWMSEEEKEDIRKTTFDREIMEDAGFSDKEIDDYLDAQHERQDAYERLDKALKQGIENVEHGDAEFENKWREERHTRFQGPPIADITAPSGMRRQGQFDVNKRFQGAEYSVPAMLQNRKMVAAARPFIEEAREAQYRILGRSYDPFESISTKPVRVFWPSKWGQGEARQEGDHEAVDALWTRRLGMMTDSLGDGEVLAHPGSSENQPILRRLLQND